MNVVDLSHIELATEEDRKYHIHEWAALFKAETWEEIKVLASKDEYLNQASQTMFRMSADEQIRKRCLDREEYYQDLRNYERTIEKYERDREEHEQDLRNYEHAIEKYERDREEHEQNLRNYERTIEKYERDKEERERALAEREARIQQLLAENQMLKEQAGTTNA